jgi:tRNA U34 5-methylaminomethyl-2-thiouridine-forming methyltransferase MnmC
MKNRNIHPVKTNDGSFTLFFEELNEHYHSKDGALGESLHVYIKNGLERVGVESDPIRILEIGTGTGLNVILSLDWAIKNERKLEYTGLEPYPIDEKTHAFLKENTAIFSEYSREYDFLQKKDTSDNHQWSEFFTFSLLTEKIEEFNSAAFDRYFDVIYFDAFAPSKQQEMWVPEVLHKCASILRDGGVLTSYCASGQFKRSLKSAGFEIIREKGYAMKREMFVGIKKPGH